MGKSDTGYFCSQHAVHFDQGVLEANVMQSIFVPRVRQGSISLRVLVCQDHELDREAYHLRVLMCQSNTRIYIFVGGRSA